MKAENAVIKGMVIGKIQIFLLWRSKKLALSMEMLLLKI